jgi:flavin-dependent dehydrogenase
MSHGVPVGTRAGDARFDCDVIVVGGGPAGSAAAAWLARAGRRVILFERDQFPRFHIGESLLASVNDVLGAIGAERRVREAGFPRKWGATFMTADGNVERYADFGVAPGVLAPQTWQVPRATFDDLLLRHAASSGAQVRERHRVLDVSFDADGVTASVQGEEGSPRAVRAQAIIDASGRGALLSRKFGLRVDDPRLANLAVFSHYSGVPRQPGRRAGDIRIIARDDLGWFWLIPISDDLMSVGVVLPRAAAQALVALEPGVLLERMIADTPAVARLLAAARREWPVRVEKDFSFGSRAYAGDRWALAGDAGSFLDPVFSTGVAIALESGLEAAQAMTQGLASGDLSVRRFARFARRQRRRYLSFRRFVLAFYTPEFRDLFFHEDPPRRMFRALVTVFAGYWRPSLATRVWVALFFLLVRLQRRVRFVPPLISNRTEVGLKGNLAG